MQWLLCYYVHLVIYLARLVNKVIREVKEVLNTSNHTVSFVSENEF